MEPAGRLAIDRAVIPSSPSEPATRCLNDLKADFERQGGLAPDDVYRLISAHGLRPEDAAVVLRGLVEIGLRVDDEDDEIDLDDDRSPDPTRWIGSHQLLSAADEVRLGRRIRLGLDASAELAGGEPTESQAKIIRDGLEAHQTLVRSNVRLVISIAKRYLDQGLDLDDLIQEGVLGIMRAANKFDHTLGFKFSTYATWWVRQAIDRAIANTSRTIRLPVHVVDDMQQVLRTQRRMEFVLGRPPTLSELSFELDMKIEKVSALLDYSRDVVSLDRLISEDTPLGDLRASTITAPDLTVERELLREDFEDCLRAVGFTLNPRSEDILRRRFGFANDGEPQTLEDIGLIYGVTRERIRQIESKTLASAFVHELFQDLNESWFGDETE